MLLFRHSDGGAGADGAVLLMYNGVRTSILGFLPDRPGPINNLKDQSRMHVHVSAVTSIRAFGRFFHRARMSTESPHPSADTLIIIVVNFCTSTKFVIGHPSQRWMVVSVARLTGSSMLTHVRTSCMINFLVTSLFFVTMPFEVREFLIDSTLIEILPSVKLEIGRPSHISVQHGNLDD